MFEDWKRAWREAIDNFERELRAGDEDAAAFPQRASAMRRDLAAARSILGRLENDLFAARSDLAGEEEAEQTARRRAEMAARIDDTETIRLAQEFAQRHSHRAGILRRKVEVLEDELAMRREELATMEQQAAAAFEKIDALGTDDVDFRKLERERREKAADARLEELKKRMQN